MDIDSVMRKSAFMLDDKHYYFGYVAPRQLPDMPRAVSVNFVLPAKSVNDFSIHIRHHGANICANKDDVIVYCEETDAFDVMPISDLQAYIMNDCRITSKTSCFSDETAPLPLDYYDGMHVTVMSEDKFDNGTILAVDCNNIAYVHINGKVFNVPLKDLYTAPSQQSHPHLVRTHGKLTIPLPALRGREVLFLGRKKVVSSVTPNSELIAMGGDQQNVSSCLLPLM